MAFRVKVQLFSTCGPFLTCYEGWCTQPRLRLRQLPLFATQGLQLKVARSLLKQNGPCQVALRRRQASWKAHGKVLHLGEFSTSPPQEGEGETALPKPSERRSL